MTQTVTETDRKLRFETFPIVAQLFATSTKPLVKNEPQPVRDLVSGGRIHMPMPTMSTDTVFQAGSKGILIQRNSASARHGRAVYYSQNINRVFYEFVRKNKYFLAENYLNAPADKTFDVGSMEFKYAWKIVEEGEDVSDFFVTSADIHPLQQTVPGQITIDRGASKKVRVALVGVHVVGVVEDHPEFVWATFEHKRNAPNLPDGIQRHSTDAVSNEDWTFYRRGTPAAQSNVPNSRAITLVEAKSQRLSPVTNVFRQHAWGGAKSDKIEDIVSLNTNVRNNVLGEKSVWRNYFLVGAVWGDPFSLKPNRSLSPGTGSPYLSNTTMETFTQDVGCFACHTTLGAKREAIELPPKNMNISHIMKDGYFRNLQRASARTHR